MDSCWCLTGITKFCLMAVSSKSLEPKSQTLAGTAAWPLTVQETAVGITILMSWVQRQLFFHFGDFEFVTRGMKSYYLFVCFLLSFLDQFLPPLLGQALTFLQRRLQ